MVTRMLLLLAATTSAAFAQQCAPFDGLKSEAWVNSGGDGEPGISGFDFPARIRRVFPGVLDRSCEGAPGGPPPPPRDPDFCLPQSPFGPQGKQLLPKGSFMRRELCNRCPPQAINYFRLPLWEMYAEVVKEMRDNPAFLQQNPHLLLSDENGRPTNEFKRGFCLTCYALAKKPPNFEASLQEGVPPVLGPTDVKKETVTITTRVACGKQNDDHSGFDLPDPAVLNMYDTQIETLAAKNDPCTHFPCGDRDRVIAQQRSLAQVKQIMENREKHIASFIKTTTDEAGESKAVNGHHEDLMEVPFGMAHVLRAEVNLNAGFEGFTDSIPDGGYTYYDGEYEKPYQGCQALEYGMVALSPGLVETACWLVPMFQDSEGWPDRLLNKWRQVQRRKESDIKNKVVEEAARMQRLLRDYCVEKRPTMDRDLTKGEHERGTRTCEVLFCAGRQYPAGSAEDDACREVMQNAASYKKLFQERNAARKGAGAVKRGGRGGGFGGRRGGGGRGGRGGGGHGHAHTAGGGHGQWQG